MSAARWAPVMGNDRDVVAGTVFRAVSTVARDEGAREVARIWQVLPGRLDQALRIKAARRAAAPDLEVQVHDVLAIEWVGTDDAQRCAGCNRQLGGHQQRGHMRVVRGELARSMINHDGPTVCR